MSHCCDCRWAEEPFVPAVEEDEPPQGLIVGDLTDTHQPSVDPQQTPEVFTPEHPGDQDARTHSPQTVPAGPSGTAMQGLCPSEVAGALSTATPGLDSPQGIISGSEAGQNLSGAPDDHDRISPDEGDTDEDIKFTVPASDIARLCEEYENFANLKENAEIVLTEAMEATKQLNIVFNQIKTSMNEMSPMMKKLLIVSKPKSSGKTIVPLSPLRLFLLLHLSFISYLLIWSWGSLGAL
ncbi:hypothetical protein M422DRAFT_241387 [Sphaerobolus stellatus SS14]|nr:hypothetical protein M422DRAFT_241387 [Sphaerobolus stellatus SS14]